MSKKNMSLQAVKKLKIPFYAPFYRHKIMAPLMTTVAGLLATSSLSGIGGPAGMGGLGEFSRPAFNSSSKSSNNSTSKGTGSFEVSRKGGMLDSNFSPASFKSHVREPHNSMPQIGSGNIPRIFTQAAPAGGLHGSNPRDGGHGRGARGHPVDGGAPSISHAFAHPGGAQAPILNAFLAPLPAHNAVAAAAVPDDIVSHSVLNQQQPQAPVNAALNSPIVQAAASIAELPAQDIQLPPVQVQDQPDVVNIALPDQDLQLPQAQPDNVVSHSVINQQQPQAPVNAALNSPIVQAAASIAELPAQDIQLPPVQVQDQPDVVNIALPDQDLQLPAGPIPGIVDVTGPTEVADKNIVAPTQPLESGARMIPAEVSALVQVAPLNPAVQVIPPFQAPGNSDSSALQTIATNLMRSIQNLNNILREAIPFQAPDLEPDLVQVAPTEAADKNIVAPTQPLESGARIIPAEVSALVQIAPTNPGGPLAAPDLNLSLNAADLESDLVQLTPTEAADKTIVAPAQPLESGARMIPAEVSTLVQIAPTNPDGPLPAPDLNVLLDTPELEPDLVQLTPTEVADKTIIVPAQPLESGARMIPAEVSTLVQIVPTNPDGPLPAPDLNVPLDAPDLEPDLVQVAPTEAADKNIVAPTQPLESGARTIIASKETNVVPQELTAHAAILHDYDLEVTQVTTPFVKKTPRDLKVRDNLPTSEFDPRDFNFANLLNKEADKIVAVQPIELPNTLKTSLQRAVQNFNNGIQNMGHLFRAAAASPKVEDNDFNDLISSQTNDYNSPISKDIINYLRVEKLKLEPLNDVDEEYLDEHVADTSVKILLENDEDLYQEYMELINIADQTLELESLDQLLKLRNPIQPNNVGYLSEDDSFDVDEDKFLNNDDDQPFDLEAFKQKMADLEADFSESDDDQSFDSQDFQQRLANLEADFNDSDDEHSETEILDTRTFSDDYSFNEDDSLEAYLTKLALMDPELDKEENVNSVEFNQNNDDSFNDIENLLADNQFDNLEEEDDEASATAQNNLPTSVSDFSKDVIETLLKGKLTLEEEDILNEKHDEQTVSDILNDPDSLEEYKKWIDFYNLSPQKAINIFYELKDESGEEPVIQFNTSDVDINVSDNEENPKYVAYNDNMLDIVFPHFTQSLKKLSFIDRLEFNQFIGYNSKSPTSKILFGHFVKDEGEISFVFDKDKQSSFDGKPIPEGEHLEGSIYTLPYENKKSEEPVSGTLGIAAFDNGKMEITSLFSIQAPEKIEILGRYFNKNNNNYLIFNEIENNHINIGTKLPEVLESNLLGYSFIKINNLAMNVNLKDNDLIKINMVLNKEMNKPSYEVNDINLISKDQRKDVLEEIRNHNLGKIFSSANMPDAEKEDGLQEAPQQITIISNEQAAQEKVEEEDEGVYETTRTTRANTKAGQDKDDSVLGKLRENLTSAENSLKNSFTNAMSKLGNAFGMITKEKTSKEKAEKKTNSLPTFEENQDATKQRKSIQMTKKLDDDKSS